MYFDFANVLIFLLAGMAFVAVSMILGALIRPKEEPGEDTLKPYECGEEPIGSAWVRFDIRYYTMALVYIVFAVEVAFLMPWAVVLREGLETAGIGSFALWEGLIFTVILFLGLVYVWAKGDLGWVKEFGRTRRPEGAGFGKPATPRPPAPRKGESNKKSA